MIRRPSWRIPSHTFPAGTIDNLRKSRRRGLHRPPPVPILGARDMQRSGGPPRRLGTRARRLRTGHALLRARPPPPHGAGLRVQGCDRLFFLKDGRLDDAGTCDALLHTSRCSQAMAAA